MNKSIIIFLSILLLVIAPSTYAIKGVVIGAPSTPQSAFIYLNNTPLYINASGEYATTGTCPAGWVVQQTTNITPPGSGVVCVQLSTIETDPIWVAAEHLYAHFTDLLNVQINLSGEASARVGNDTEISLNLSAERSARIGNDTEIILNSSRDYVPYNGSTRDVNLGGRTLNVSVINQNGAGTYISTTGGIYADSYNAGLTQGKALAQMVYQAGINSYWRLYTNMMALDGMNITLNASNSWYNGLFNWEITSNSQNYLTFDGHNLTLNETHLNQTVRNLMNVSLIDLGINLSAEISARILNDTELMNNLTNELAARLGNDTEIMNNLTNEIAARIGNDTVLMNNLTAEIAGRMGNDTELMNNITTEILARIGNDTAIMNNLTLEIASRLNNDTELMNNLTGEQNARINNDTEIRVDVNSINNSKAGIGICANGQVVNQTTFTGVICTTVTLLSDLLGVQNNLTYEINARIANDTAIWNNLSGETAARIANDSILSIREPNIAMRNETNYWNASQTIYINGTLFVSDNKGNVTNVNNMIQSLEEMSENTLLDASRSILSVSGSQLNYTLMALNGLGEWNFNGTIYAGPGISVPNVTITLLSGTNSTPKTNYVYFELVAGVPTLKTSETSPGASSGATIRVATFVVGDVSGGRATIYSYSRNRHENEQFVNRVISRTLDQGTLYKSGFVITAGINNITIREGYFYNGIFLMNIINNVSSNASIADRQGFYFINGTGNFIQSVNRLSITQYADGTPFTGGANERINLVWGIVPTNATGGFGPTYGKLVVILPNNPGAGNEYASVSAAIQDNFGELNYYPPNDAIKQVFVPIARTIYRPSSTAFEPFTSGIYYKDLRGNTAGSGSSSSVGISNHALLDNLAWSVSGHTIDTNVNMTYHNITTVDKVMAKGFDWKNNSFITKVTTFFNETSHCLQYNGLTSTLNIC